MTSLGLNKLTHWPLRNVDVMLKLWISNLLYRIVACAIAANLLLGECRWTLLMRSQLCSRWWLGAVKQAITWAKVDPDPCCHMASLYHNELTLLLLNLECSVSARTGSIPLLLMLWLLASLRHQQPWCWLRRINGSKCSTGKDLKYLCPQTVEKW